MLIVRGALLVCLLLLAGCASNSERKTDMDAVSASGVPQVTISKMEYNQPIDLADIKALSKQKVSDEVIIRYLRYRRTIYRLDTQAIDDLRASSVSQPLINYLLSTPSLYEMDRTRQQYIDQATTPNRDPLLNGQASPRSH